jgi:GNAT superfamily N-acetyltransferase
MLNVRRLLASELSWANQRYDEIDFVRSSEADIIAVAELEGEKVGLGRIVPVEGNAGELGGMYGLPAYRSRSVATAVIEFLLKQSPHIRLFCIPFAHLDAFYGGFGFVPVQEGLAVPAAVAEKFNWCQGHYSSPVRLLMRFCDGSAQRP